MYIRHEKIHLNHSHTAFATDSVLQADNLTSPLISIVPRPTQIVPGRGNFTFSAQTVFAVESQEQAVIARNLLTCLLVLPE